ncbi:MAG TPA: hypothetical protein VKU19_21165 [Bryobacteraceae bacterium]|nr:hypothetical protein [Bryobacteraceae bacterium]
MAISCGGSVVAELKQGTYFAINLAPGKYAFSVEGGIPLFVDVSAGEESFVRLDWNYDVGRPPIPVLAKVRESDAHADIKFLSYAGAKRIHSSMVPKSDPGAGNPAQLRRR